MPSVQQTAAFLRVAAGGERVGRGRRRDVEARHRLAGGGGELAHDPVHRRLLDLADRPRAHGADRDLVGVPVAERRHAQAEEREDEQELRGTPAEQPSDAEQDGPQDPEQSRRLQAVVVLVTHLSPHSGAPVERAQERASSLVSFPHVPTTPRSTPCAQPAGPPSPPSPPSRSRPAHPPTTTRRRPHRRQPGHRHGRRADHRHVRPGLRAVDRRQRPEQRRGVRVRRRVRGRRPAGLRRGRRRVDRRQLRPDHRARAPRTSTSRSTRCRSATSARPASTSPRRTTRPRRRWSRSRRSAGADATTIADLKALKIGAMVGTTSLTAAQEVIDPSTPVLAVQRQRPGQAGADLRAGRRDRRRPADRAVHHGRRAGRRHHRRNPGRQRGRRRVRSRAGQGQRPDGTGHRGGRRAARGRHARGPRGRVADRRRGCPGHPVSLP